MVLVRDDGVFHPIGIGRAGPAIRFEIIDPNFPRQMWASDDEPMIGAREGQCSRRRGRGGRRFGGQGFRVRLQANGHDEQESPGKVPDDPASGN